MISLSRRDYIIQPRVRKYEPLASIFATLGYGVKTSIVRGSDVAYSRSATEDEMIRGKFRPRLRAALPRRVLLGRGGKMNVYPGWRRSSRNSLHLTLG